MAPGIQITGSVLLRSILVFIVLDILILSALALLVKRDSFLGLKWECAVAATVFWAGLWLWVVTTFWGAIYSQFFAAWSRWCLPIAFGLGYGAAALVLWSTAARARTNPAITFVVMGAFLGPLTHTFAVWRGLMNAPMLRTASPLLAIAFSFPEFALYWCAILTLASAMRLVAKRGTVRRGSATAA
jgi:hypothetical protein